MYNILLMYVRNVIMIYLVDSYSEKGAKGLVAEWWRFIANVITCVVGAVNISLDQI